MELNNIYYIAKIKEDLSLKQRNNPQYSLRSYARFLGLHSSTLSQIIKGKRPLPLKDLNNVISKLGLDPKEKTLFVESLHRTKTKIDDITISEVDERYFLDESYHRIISEWEHYVTLDLFDLDNFSMSVEEVSRRLGITMTRADVVINNLITCGLLVHKNGELVKAHSNIRTTEDITSQALKEAHIENLELAKQKLEEIEVELRDFSAVTMAMDLKKLPEAKTIIREFRKKMAALLRDGDMTEVYQLAIQFYPMTKKLEN